MIPLSFHVLESRHGQTTDWSWENIVRPEMRDILETLTLVEIGILQNRKLYGPVLIAMSNLGRGAAVSGEVMTRKFWKPCGR
jgi:hypothetical protein